MNNNEQMEYIWHNIKTNLPRRGMLAVLKGGTVLWVVLLGLISFCLWQGVKLWHLDADIRNATLSIRPAIDLKFTSLLREINVKTHRLAFLEEGALLFEYKELIPWVTAQVEQSDIPRIGAKAAKTQMIGVEHLKQRKVEQYVYAPVKFTLRGDYHSFGRLMNRLERSRYPLKLDYISIARRSSAPYELLMDIVLCQVSMIGEPTVERAVALPRLKVQKKEQSKTANPNVPSIGITVSAPPKSSEKRLNYIGADFVYESSDGIRDVFQRQNPEVTPQAKSASPSPSLILTGIIYNEHNPIAIFMDGQNKSYLARVNDTILDFTVLKIELRSVILNHEDTQIESAEGAPPVELRVFKDKEIAATF